MARPDPLTYDLGTPEPPQRPWWAVPVLAAVLGAVLVLLVWAVLPAATRQQPAASTPVARSAPPAAGSATPAPSRPPTPGGTPTPAGSDAKEELTAPEGSKQAATLFVRAWLDRNPETRGPALRQVTAPALADQLLLTDPANIPAATPRGAPVLADASTFSAQFTQTLSTGMKIEVFLVADPTSRYQWLATSVDRA